MQGSECQPKQTDRRAIWDMEIPRLGLRNRRSLSPKISKLRLQNGQDLSPSERAKPQSGDTLSHQRPQTRCPRQPLGLHVIGRSPEPVIVK